MRGRRTKEERPRLLRAGEAKYSGFGGLIGWISTDSSNELEVGRAA